MKRTAEQLFDIADFMASAYRNNDFETVLDYMLNLNGVESIIVFDIIQKKHFLTETRFQKLVAQFKVWVLDDGEDEKLNDLLKSV